MARQIVKLSRFKSRRFKFFYGWLFVGIFFYFVDCLVVTVFSKRRPTLKISRRPPNRPRGRVEARN